MQYTATLLDEARAPLVGRKVELRTTTAAGDGQSLATCTTDSAGMMLYGVASPTSTATGFGGFKAMSSTGGGSLLAGEDPTPVSAVHLVLVSGQRELLLARAPIRIQAFRMDFGSLIVRESEPLITAEGASFHALPVAIHEAIHGAVLNPPLSGLTATAAARTLAEHGLRASMGTLPITNAELVGRVLEQRPDPASVPRVAIGSTIQLWLGQSGSV